MKTSGVYEGSKRAGGGFLGILCVLLANVVLTSVLISPVSGETVNGEILQQELDASRNGYTVMKVWGTYYEMGFAQGYLLADDIESTIGSLKNAVGSSVYNYLKPQMQSTVIPSDVVDEVNGIVAGVKAARASSTVDFGDLIILNTYSDWGVSPNCRSHSAWGSYVTAPVKTLSTRRTDYQASEIGSLFDSINIVVLAYQPSEIGKIRWTNLTMPGLVTAATAVNEYGTIVSLHNSPDTGGRHAAGSNVMTRAMASRFAMTIGDLPADVSQQVDFVYNALKSYSPWTGAFMNYYAPMGNAGVFSLSASQGFYALRKPKPSYYNGEVIVTSNANTDGLSTPSDASIFNNYYNDHTPKTLADHWGVLDEVNSNLGAQQLSVEYRGRGDMSIWARGRLIGTARTPIIKLEWSELFEPSIPTVTRVEITSPAAGDTFAAPANITMTADVSMTGRSVAQVLFYANDTLIGVDTSAPYSAVWKDILEGAYSLTAVARDNFGQLWTSNPLLITVYPVQCSRDEQCNDWNSCTADSCVQGVCQNVYSRAIISYPYSQGFENGWGDWVNSFGDDIDWIRNTGSTPSNRTGPQGAHTGSYYIYLEASLPNYPDKASRLVSPSFDLTNMTEAEMTFWYHMYGSAMGTLYVDVSEDCGSWNNVWSISGDQGTAWHQAIVDLTPFIGKTIDIRIEGVTGSGYQGDLAIDDVGITAASEISCAGDADCDDGVFCNGIETCSTTLGCQPGNDPCLGSYCDEVNDVCYECETDSECDDGIFCNGTEICVDGVCQSSNDPCSGQDCDEVKDECVAIVNNQMFVNTIDVSKYQKWVLRRGMASVKIVGSDGNPIEGVTVTGRWHSGANDLDQNVTGSDGWVGFSSNWHWGDATFAFCVTHISKGAWNYDPVMRCGQTN